MKLDMKIGFVILHYMCSDITEKCVESILNISNGKNVHIVVVDNASPNKSGLYLKERYTNDDKITVLLNKENLGFARGNNSGYVYLKEHFAPEFIVVLNNDVIIEQKDFIEGIENLFEREAYAVLGPDIFCPYTGAHQNPAHLNGFSKQEIIQQKKNLIKKMKYYPLYFIKENVKSILAGFSDKGKATSNLKKYDATQHNVVLHGACYIFSPLFIDRRDLVFCPDTFLYFEEDILHYECSMMQMKMVYSPEIKVNHYEDSATNASYRSKYKKNIMKNKYMLASINVMLDKMQ